MVSLHKTAGRMALAACLTVFMAACLALPAQATPPKAPQRVEAVFLGDRLVDVAFNLGFVAEGTSLRCSLCPGLCGKIKAATQVLGCPGCIVKKRPETLPTFLKERGIRRVIVEKSEKFCLYVPGANPMKAVPLIEGQDVDIQYVDFSRGLPEAIRRTAELLGVPEKGEELAARYVESFEKAKAAVPRGGLNKKVVILNGIHQAATGKIFLRVEMPGGYADQYILGPLGCRNIGGALFEGKPTVSRGHCMIRSLKGLLRTRPDAIVMTGDSAGVQKALAGALAENPELAEVPALRTLALFSLPGYVDSAVVEYPETFMRWQSALSGL
ncbi:ABC transporter substrate-binding protein [Desulfocurvus sp. DL9XJH121]